MFWAWDITIPAGRSASNPVTQILKLSAGVITEVDVKFPSGCHGLVKVRLSHQGFQLVPLSRREWVTGDDEAVKMPLFFELSPGVAKLKFEGASPDASFDHKVTVRATVLPKQVASMAPLLELLTKLLQRMGVLR